MILDIPPMTTDRFTRLMTAEVARWPGARLVKVTEHPLTATVEINGVMREIVAVPFPKGVVPDDHYFEDMVVSEWFVDLDLDANLTRIEMGLAGVSD